MAPRPAQYKFKPRSAGIGEMLRSPMMVAEMLRRAQQAKAVAEVIAPRRTGKYAKSFRASAVKRGGIHKDRACGRLTNRDPAAYQIEVGTKDTPAHRTMITAMFSGMAD
jgi:hypothetical protein